MEVIRKEHMKCKYIGPCYCWATLAASHAAFSELRYDEYADGTDRQSDRRTDGRQTVKLRFPLYAAMGEHLLREFMKS